MVDKKCVIKKKEIENLKKKVVEKKIYTEIIYGIELKHFCSLIQII